MAHCERVTCNKSKFLRATGQLGSQMFVSDQGSYFPADMYFTNRTIITARMLEDVFWERGEWESEWEGLEAWRMTQWQICPWKVKKWRLEYVHFLMPGIWSLLTYFHWPIFSEFNVHKLFTLSIFGYTMLYLWIWIYQHLPVGVNWQVCNATISAPKMEAPGVCVNLYIHPGSPRLLQHNSPQFWMIKVPYFNKKMVKTGNLWFF